MTIFGYKLSEMRKATRPALLALVAVLANWLASGSFGRTEFAVALSGVVVSVLSFSLTNSEKFPILKAIIPPIIVNIAVLTTLIESGHLDRPALSAIAYSIAAALLAGHATNEGLPPGGSDPTAVPAVPAAAQPAAPE